MPKAPFRRPLKRCWIGTVVGSGRTICGALRSSASRSRSDFAHESNLAVLEIAQAAVDHARRRRAAGAAEVAALDQQHVDALQRQLAEDADAVDAAADDQRLHLGVRLELGEHVFPRSDHRKPCRQIRRTTPFRCSTLRRAVPPGAAWRPRRCDRDRPRRTQARRRARSPAPVPGCAPRRARR